MSTRTGVLIVACLSAVIAPAVPGCRESSPPPASETGAQGDPRFASAEAAAAAFSELNALGRDAGPAFVNMLYAETPWQTEFLAIEHLRIRVHNAECAMMDRFGESLRGDAQNLLYTPILGTADILEHETDRAVARLSRGGSESRMKLHFVRVGERWWLSLYSFEYTFPDEERATMIADSHVWEAMAAAADQVFRSMQNGEYTSAADVQSAFRTAIQEYAITHPAGG